MEEKLASQTWTARCPRCNKQWQVDQGTSGWMAAREKQMQGREAKIVCDECLRQHKKSSNDGSIVVLALECLSGL